VLGGSRVARMVLKICSSRQVEALVERQQSMPSECNDNGLSCADRTVDLGCLGPVSRSETEDRAFRLATVFGLTP
jgi:hypothetical protein